MSVGFLIFFVFVWIIIIIKNWMEAKYDIYVLDLPKKRMKIFAFVQIVIEAFLAFILIGAISILFGCQPIF